MAKIRIGYVRGPQGPAGERGQTGPVGPQGPPGPGSTVYNGLDKEDAGVASLDAYQGKVLKSLVDSFRERLDEEAGKVAQHTADIDENRAAVEQNATEIVGVKEGYMPKSGGDFTGDITLNKISPTLSVKNNDISRGTTPSSDKYTQILFKDMYDRPVGGVQTVYRSGGSIETKLIGYAPTETNKNASIDIRGNADGTVTTYAPTPPSTDNSMQIATTKYVNDKIGGSSSTSKENISVTSGSWKHGVNYVTVSENGAYIVELVASVSATGATVRKVAPVVDPSSLSASPSSFTVCGGKYDGDCNIRSTSVVHGLTKGQKVYPTAYYLGSSGTSVDFKEVTIKMTRIR